MGSSRTMIEDYRRHHFHDIFGIILYWFLLYYSLKNRVFGLLTMQGFQNDKNNFKIESLVSYWALAHSFIKQSFLYNVNSHDCKEEIREVCFSGYFLWCTFCYTKLQLTWEAIKNKWELLSTIYGL